MGLFIIESLVVFLATLAVLTINEQHKEVLRLRAELSKADFELAINKVKNNKE
ncbi:hypothetical protein [Weissella paramesenteroides]|uniref:hypothetical protein n=1 Tax=Weissella paramesenteroides TaxID=1249 RepID=UPI0039819F02